MKKTLALGLALVAVLMALTACTKTEPSGAGRSAPSGFAASLKTLADVYAVSADGETQEGYSETKYVYVFQVNGVYYRAVAQLESDVSKELWDIEYGEDQEQKIQALLELIGVPYTGSGPLASAIAMNKAMAKRVLANSTICTPAWRELDYTEADIPRLTEELPVPCAVKVIDGGSSIGVELPDTREELAAALKRILRYGSHVIVENKIFGRELTVPVLDGHALNPIEVIPPEGTEFDYVAKYQSGALGAREICPANLTPEEDRRLREAAETVQKELDLRVYSRSDFILDRDGQPWFLEVNTLPGMTPNSLIPRSARVDGISYDELCEKIVMLSLRESRR